MDPKPGQPTNSQTEGQIEFGENDFRGYTLRGGCEFSNLEYKISHNFPSLQSEINRVGTVQGVAQAIWGIRNYIETQGASTTSDFSHGIAYLRSLAEECDQEAYELLEQVYKGEGLIREEKLINLRKILERLEKVRERLELNDDEYFTFGEKMGFKTEDIITNGIEQSLFKLLPFGLRMPSSKDPVPEEIKIAYEEWLSAKEKPFPFFIEKSKELLKVLLDKDSNLRFDVEYFHVSQSLTKAEEILREESKGEE
ncbi:MAG: hypothetical protein WC640_01245 [Candidatus Paceibacterota bacterium]|jgi:hypothetical protein